jgi:hypothetical protein
MSNHSVSEPVRGHPLPGFNEPSNQFRELARSSHWQVPKSGRLVNGDPHADVVVERRFLAVGRDQPVATLDDSQVNVDPFACMATVSTP